jgi:DNA polymerase-3 subunit gamma/tau
VKFVLATTDVRKVPETIVSRCQRFDFRRLTVAQIAEQLRRVAQAEGMVFSDASLALVARGAEGGMRDALSLLDRVRAACGDRPGDAEVAEAVGVVDSASVARIAWGLVRRDGAAVLAEIAALHERGLEMRRVAEEVVRHLRNAAVARLVPGAPLDLADAERQEVLAQAQAAPPEQLVRLFDVAQRAVFEVRMADQPRYALEVALLKGVFLAPGAEVSELIARLEELAAGGGPASAGPTGTFAPRTPATQGPLTPSAGPPQADRSRGAPTAPPTSSPATNAEPITPSPSTSLGAGSASPQGEQSRGAPTSTDRAIAPFGTPGCAVPAPSPPGAPGVAGSLSPAGAGERGGPWRALVEQAEQASPMVGQVLRQAVLLKLAEGEVAIQVAPGLAAQTAERRRGEIEAVLERFFGRPTRLAVTASAAPPPEAAGGASLAQVDQEEREARSARVREAARSHANIREAARILDADVAKVDEL